MGNRRNASDSSREQRIMQERRKSRILKTAFIISESVLFIIVVACAIILHMIGDIKVIPLPKDEIVHNTRENKETEVYIDVNGSTHYIEATGSEKPETMPMPFAGEEYTTIVVFGLDGRADITSLEDSSNSDVMILVSINNNTGAIRMVSVYRDTMMKLYKKDGEDEWCKANYPMCAYGVKSAINTLNTNLDLDIEHYVTINWASAVEIIDALGGVDFVLDPAFWEIDKYDENTGEYLGKVVYLNGLIDELVKNTGVPSLAIPKENFNGELWHGNGIQAVAYMRLRRTDSDLARTARQREIIGKIVEKAKQADVSTLIDIFDIVKQNMSLSMNQSDVLGLIYNISKYHIEETGGYPFDLYGGGDYTSDDLKWMIIPVDVELNVKKLHKFLYDQDDYEPTDDLKNIGNYIRQQALFDENWNITIETTGYVE